MPRPNSIETLAIMQKKPAKQIVEDALNAHRGEIAKAALQIGVTTGALQNWLNSRGYRMEFSIRLKKVAEPQ